jgi:hypothetical protein
MGRTIHRWAPLTGALFVIAAAVGFFISGEPPDVDDSVQEVVDFYVDNDTAIMVGSLLEAVAGLALIFFAATLARIVQVRKQVVLPWVVLAGGAVAAAGFGVDASLRFAAADVAGDIDPVVVQTIHVVFADFFYPMVIGFAAFLFGASIAAIRTKVFPVWLAWIGILLAVVAFTPVGFIAALVSLLWILILSILLFVREGKQPSIADGASAAAAV